MQKISLSFSYKWFLILLLLASSCIHYHPRPIKLPTSSDWKTEQLLLDVAAESPEKGKAPIAKWWGIFDDQLLNKLEKKALKNSPTIKAAIARLKEAEALYMVTSSDLFPHLNLFASATRQHIPESILQAAQTSSVSRTTPTSPSVTESSPSSTATTTGLPTTGGLPTPPGILSPTTSSSSSSLTSTGATGATEPSADSFVATSSVRANQSFLQVVPELSYELDIWGKFANASNAACMDIKANCEDLQATYLLLSAQVAQNYFELQAADNEINVYERSIASYKEQVKLTTARFEAGLVSKLDLLQAEVELNNVEAEYAQQKTIRRFAENMLAVLLGESAASFSIPTQTFNPKLVTVPVCLPSELLKQRPDIRRAEDLVEEARHLVGVAKTAFFPSIILTGDTGYQSNKASNLFKWKNHLLSGTAALFAPIFDAGRNLGAYRNAKAKYQERVANYVDTVITAYREVEDALYAFKSAITQEEFRKKENESAVSLRDLSVLKYKHGLGDYYIVIYAERVALNSELDFIQAKRRQVSQTIALVRSIGGIW